MKRTICTNCGRAMLDDDGSIRFRCRYCKELIEGWEQVLHEKLKEALLEQDKDKDE